MEHKSCQHNTSWYVNPDDWGVYTNNIESLWRSIKYNINGCRHKVSVKHMQKYLDEAVYRYNYKEGGSRFVFDNVLRIAVAQKNEIACNFRGLQIISKCSITYLR